MYKLAFLTVLFAGALAFQATVSATIWSEAQHNGGQVLVWLALLTNLHLVNPLAVCCWGSM